MKLVEIAANTQVPVGTCSEIINKEERDLKLGIETYAQPRVWPAESDSLKGCNRVSTAAENKC